MARWPGGRGVVCFLRWGSFFKERILDELVGERPECYRSHPINANYALGRGPVEFGGFQADPKRNGDLLGIPARATGLDNFNLAFG